MFLIKHSVQTNQGAILRDELLPHGYESPFECVPLITNHS
jgi:hypothetical protein